MNQFGGNWSKIKIEILVKYAQAYLQIMKNQPWFKLLYFDGFAGSGSIMEKGETDRDETIGAAVRIVEIEKPRPFDLYYFVEKKRENAKLLRERTKLAFPEKTIHVAAQDCNRKLKDMAAWLRQSENKNFRTLAYIDPFGMQVEWDALENLRGLSMDLWILVPTGMGVNRLLKRNGEISDAWLKRLEKFLGMDKEEIKSYFYTTKQTLFPEILDVSKEQQAIQKSAELYGERLRTIFNFVSKPYELKNRSNTIMYHLFFAANNSNGAKIANDIVRQYNT